MTVVWGEEGGEEKDNLLETKRFRDLRLEPPLHSLSLMAVVACSGTTVVVEVAVCEVYCN